MDILQELTDLDKIILRLEQESNKATSMIINVGHERYLVGDLTARKGQYKVEMQEEYSSAIARISFPPVTLTAVRSRPVENLFYRFIRNFFPD